MLLSYLLFGLSLSHPSHALHLGSTNFTTSCSPEATAHFQIGLQWLHLFATADSIAAFSSTLKADPGCAIGYYGLAMTQKLPLWASENVAAANAYLKNIDQLDLIECQEFTLLNIDQSKTSLYSIPTVDGKRCTTTVSYTHLTLPTN